MEPKEPKSKLHKDVWEVIRREEEEMGAFPAVDIKALVAESGRAYRAEYVRRHSPAEEESPTWAQEMRTLLWELTLKTRNPVREVITVGVLAALPLFPCLAISYYLLVNSGAKSRQGMVALFLMAGVCLVTSSTLFLKLQHKVKRLGVPKFNATFNSRTFWGTYSHAGGGLLVGSTAAVLIAALTPPLLSNIHLQKRQAAVASVQESRIDAQSYENVALDLAEKEAVASIESLQDPAAASAIVEGETKIVRDDKPLSMKTTRPTPTEVKRDISSCDPNIPVVVSAECSPNGGRIYSVTMGGRSALLTRYLVGRVDGYQGGRVLVRVSGSDGTSGIREIAFDAAEANRPSVGERTIVVIDGASGRARGFKELLEQPRAGQQQRFSQNTDNSTARTANVSEARPAEVPPE